MASFEVLEPPQAGEETRKEEAERQVRIKLQECAMMGRNDSEFSRFNEILGLLRRDECSPREALQMAYDIRDGKQEH